MQYLTSRGYLQTVAAFQTEGRGRVKQATPTQTTGLQVAATVTDELTLSLSHLLIVKYRMSF